MEPQTNKFSEISPVLELIYVMLTNMNKYLQVYANDIDAAKLQQYLDAKEALELALKKFDALYGLDSSQTVQEAVDSVQVEDEEEASETFDSNSDPDSVKKAKEAVAELKQLFNEMKESEQNSENGQKPAPKADLPPIAEEEKVQSVDSIPSTSVDTSKENTSPAPKQVAAPPVVASEENSAESSAPSEPKAEEKNPDVVTPQQDAAEIDSILAELRKLQNKGEGEL